MRILALALADESQRFVRGYPARGSVRARQPNLEILTLAALARPEHDFQYRDQRVEPLDIDNDTDLVLCHIDLFQEDAGRSLASQADGRLVFFGRQATLWGLDPPDWVRSHVVGDVTRAWPNLIADAGNLQKVYQAIPSATYVAPDRSLPYNPELHRGYQSIRFARGCNCLEPFRPYCTESLYCHNQTLQRSKDEIVGEVLSLPGKRVHLLDDDVARWPEYYAEVFAALWPYRREWLVNASTRIFDYPQLLRLLAKAGVKAIVLDESLLWGKLEQASTSHQLTRQLYRRVKSIHAARMLVGARVPVVRKPDTTPDYLGTARLLQQLDLDFIYPRVFVQEDSHRLRLQRTAYRPALAANQAAVVADYFYSLGAIIDRVLRRPRRVGFYTTAYYLLPLSLAARQDFYEGLPLI